MGLTRNVFYKNELMSVRHVECRSAEKGVGNIEHSDADTLILPLHGAFLGHFSPRTEVLAEPNVALIFPAGRAYKVSHPYFTEDDCLVVECSTQSFQGIVDSTDLPKNRAIGTHAVLTPSGMALRNLLLHRLTRGACDPLEVEETGLGLLRSVLKDVLDAAVTKSRSSNGDSQHRMRAQMDAVKFALLKNPERKWNLTALAGLVELSPFYLARSFRRQVGLPIHRYHLHTRLSRAFDLLLDTDQEITSIALHLGFSSHSHFTEVFRKNVGFPPARFRSAISPGFAVEARKDLLKRLQSSRSWVSTVRHQAG